MLLVYPRPNLYCNTDNRKTGSIIHACNKSDCCRLQKVVSERRHSSTFCNKICTRWRFTGPRQTCFEASNVTLLYGVTPT